MRIEVEITKLQAFLDSVRLVKATENTVKAQYRSQVAEGFSPCNLFSPNEVVISRVLAFLFNPLENHAQGRIFLNAFMSAIESKQLIRNQGKISNMPIFSEKVDVTTEYSVDQGRPDIVLTEASSILVIENKPWALDQEKQLQRYGEWIISRSEKKRLLIYLCQNEPSEYTLPKNSEVESFTVHLSFNELINVLRVANHQTKSLKVRYFVDSFCDFLQTSVCQENLMENPLIVNMMKDPKNLQAYFEIEKNMPRLYQQAWKNFCHELEKLAEERFAKERFGVDLKFAHEDRCNQKKGAVLTFFYDKKPWKIYIRAEKENLQNINFGVIFDEREASNKEQLQISQTLNNIISKGESNTVFPWWQWGSQCITESDEYKDIPITWATPTILNDMLKEGETALSRLILDKVALIADALYVSDEHK